MVLALKRFRAAALCLVAIGTLSSARADTTDPGKAYKEITDWRTQQVKAAEDAKKDVDYQAIYTAAAAKAKAATEGVDAARVAPERGLDWARLFELAEQPANVVAAADRFLTSNPGAAARFGAQMIEVSAFAEQDDGAKLYTLLGAIKPPDKVAAAHLASVAGNCASLIAVKVNPRAALDLLTKVEAQIPWSEFTAEQEKGAAESAALSLASAKAEILTTQHKTTEALAALESCRKRLTPTSRYTRQLTMQITAVKLVGAPAPTIVRERGYGEFPGLAAYRGKVVLIDFMAHWCGPCKASLPSMKRLYNDYHSRGLEIVSVTSYYGFFGKEQKLTPDAEFAKMDGFVKDEGMTWPVAFGPKGNSESYGVAGIPNFILIDKEGNVNSITVGYSPELFAGMRKSVEALLGVKVALK